MILGQIFSNKWLWLIRVGLGSQQLQIPNRHWTTWAGVIFRWTQREMTNSPRDESLATLAPIPSCSGLKARREFVTG